MERHREPSVLQDSPLSCATALSRSPRKSAQATPGSPDYPSRWGCSDGVPVLLAARLGMPWSTPSTEIS